MNSLSTFLETHGIAPVTHSHQAVMTVAEAEQLLLSLPGAMTKNLFLRDNKGRRHFLVTVPHTLTVDLTALGKVLAAGRLGFAIWTSVVSIAHKAAKSTIQQSSESK